MNKIFIKDYIIKAIHGFYEHEQKNPQNFRVNIIVELQDKIIWNEDNLEKTLNYEEIKNIVDNIFLNQKYKLLELIAENISKEILKYEIVKSVEIEISKIDIWKDCIPGIIIKRFK